MKTVNLDITKIGATVTELERFLSYLEKQLPRFIAELGRMGANIAQSKFDSAVYDGANDVTVTVEEAGDNEVAVIAHGGTALFIEFGTGTRYPDIHPEKPMDPGFVGRGQYGQGKGANPPWAYYGEPGTNGHPLRENTKKGTLYLTRGNPANMPLYRTREELREEALNLARKVFGSYGRE